MDFKIFPETRQEAMNPSLQHEATAWEGQFDVMLYVAYEHLLTTVDHPWKLKMDPV